MIVVVVVGAVVGMVVGVVVGLGVSVVVGVAVVVVLPGLGLNLGLVVNECFIVFLTPWYRICPIDPHAVVILVLSMEEMGICNLKSPSPNVQITSSTNLNLIIVNAIKQSIFLKV